MTGWQVRVTNPLIEKGKAGSLCLSTIYYQDRASIVLKFDFYKCCSIFSMETIEQKVFPLEERAVLVIYFPAIKLLQKVIRS